MPANAKPPRPRYVDGFVLPVRKTKVDEYKKLARLAAKVFVEHGALEYRECIAEDLKPGFGLPFPDMVKPKRGETIVFAWIAYKSRAQRDRVNKKVMNDPRMQDMCGGKPMPFDMERMAWGGFDVLVAS